VNLSGKLPLSVTMIARNEAHRLPRSLGSVAGWVEEIVVVVNDCTDNTVEVAKSYGAIVSEHPFASMRDQNNVVLSRATREWVLSIDADEEVSPELKEEIAKFFQSGRHEALDGAYFPRRLWFLGRWIRHGDNYPDYVLRLFRREKAKWTGSPEHYQLSLDGKAEHFRSDLLHYSNDSINGHISKINYFADAHLRRQLEKGKRFSIAETLFRPVWRFLRSYVLRRGFLDGFPGLYLAAATAFATFVRYSRMYEHEQKKT